jgi:uncharacterized protein (DUF302 family)
MDNPMSNMDNGVRSVTAPHPANQIVQQLTSVLNESGIKLFTLIDHSAEAAAVGLSLPPTMLLIFGNPRAGTPVMIASRSAALDLPLKILVSQEPNGSSTIYWNDPGWLQQRHEIWPEFLPNISVVESLVHKAIR